MPSKSDHVHLARAELVDTRVAARKKTKQDFFDRSWPTPIVFVSLEQQILACLPLFHAIRPRSEWVAVIFGKRVQVLSVENVLRKRAAPELVLIAA